MWSQPLIGRDPPLIWLYHKNPVRRLSLGFAERERWYSWESKAAIWQTHGSNPTAEIYSQSGLEFCKRWVTFVVGPTKLTAWISSLLRSFWSKACFKVEIRLVFFFYIYDVSRPMEKTILRISRFVIGTLFPMRWKNVEISESNVHRRKKKL